MLTLRARLAIAGGLLTANAVAFAMVWALIGAWFLPWTLLFVHAPSLPLVLVALG